MDYEDEMLVKLRAALAEQNNLFESIIGQTEPQKIDVPKITWDDVQGLEEPKRLLREALETPRNHTTLYKFYNKQPPKGILLYGPPGCGKTMLGKAAATAMGVGEDGFIYTSGPELMDKYVGGTEKKIRDIFARARTYADKNGHPAILFFDEVDSLLMARKTGVWYLDSQVNQFLTEMDGMAAQSAIVILATNQHSKLDAAVLREGRVDYKIAVPRPDRDVAHAIIQHNLKPLPLQGALADYTAQTVTALFSEEYTLKKIKTAEGRLNFTLGDVLSGALLAQVVEHAKGIALRRDIAANHKKGRGLHVEDLLASVAYSYQQTKAMPQEDNITMFLEAQGYTV